MSNTPEPAPTPRPDRPASWDQVIAFTTAAFPQTEERDALIRDMSDRHQTGLAKYGTPLTAGNGRNSLIDAWQEAMDLAVYLRTALEEVGIDPLKQAGPVSFTVVEPKHHAILGMFAGAVQTALLLKTLLMGNDIEKAGIILGLEAS